MSHYQKRNPFVRQIRFITHTELLAILKDGVKTRNYNENLVNHFEKDLKKNGFISITDHLLEPLGLKNALDHFMIIEPSVVEDISDPQKEIALTHLRTAAFKK